MLDLEDVEAERKVHCDADWWSFFSSLADWCACREVVCAGTGRRSSGGGKKNPHSRIWPSCLVSCQLEAGLGHFAFR